ncbi:hypothetical protein [Sulfurimonas sp. RIFOXYB12_FULL_35_9]|jgi:hypothetical protein|uniref:hypothetical protein n=1 Tax=Sulfurimonas sp. RIFOXYB12_FULL_35_9 TaxID=1802256 RepID=UPI0008CB9399|nr:hypothetical protein [Sulfurimonas sp. RIFOXYB12_FULL_35_9]MBS4068679.1 hypothetical protein [Sulfurimonas sp.]OHE03678.1 MAG: hypothetical protein A2345_04840 [Sulfurimonas sp. RIFOXYB12_FULL_35_9]
MNKNINQKDIFDKYVTKLKIMGMILFALLTFNGIVFSYLFDNANQFAKLSNEYSVKCLKETNPEIKSKYQEYLSYLKNTLKDMVQIPISIIGWFTLFALIPFMLGLYYFYKVIRL